MSTFLVWKNGEGHIKMIIFTKATVEMLAILHGCSIFFIKDKAWVELSSHRIKEKVALSLRHRHNSF